ncbi:MAG: orotidine-5'-phosphate decarboxylase [Solirubrobacterales bacterium]
MSNPVFVAIDTTDSAKAVELARSLSGAVGGIKLGLEFFTANGPGAVAEVSAALGMPLFIDLKLHDIPNTVAGGMKGVARLKPVLTTIHASGGAEMMRAAVAAAREHSPTTKVLAVTILTSIDQAAMTAIGFGGAVLDQVKRLAALAQEAGVDGLVCSPHEVEAVRALVGPGMTLVVPGIRPAWAEAGDQKRFMTPRQAIERGADVLVIGRPITGAADPAEAARRIAAELA